MTTYNPGDIVKYLQWGKEEGPFVVTKQTANGDFDILELQEVGSGWTRTIVADWVIEHETVEEQRRNNIRHSIDAINVRLAENAEERSMLMRRWAELQRSLDPRDDF